MRNRLLHQRWSLALLLALVMMVCVITNVSDRGAQAAPEENEPPRSSSSDVSVPEEETPSQVIQPAETPSNGSEVSEGISANTPAAPAAEDDPAMPGANPSLTATSSDGVTVRVEWEPGSLYKYKYPTYTQVADEDVRIKVSQSTDINNSLYAIDAVNSYLDGLGDSVRNGLKAKDAYGEYFYLYVEENGVETKIAPKDDGALTLTITVQPTSGNRQMWREGSAYSVVFSSYSSYSASVKGKDGFTVNGTAGNGFVNIEIDKNEPIVVRVTDDNLNTSYLRNEYNVGYYIVRSDAYDDYLAWDWYNLARALIRGDNVTMADNINAYYMDGGPSGYQTGRNYLGSAYYWTVNHISTGCYHIAGRLSSPKAFTLNLNGYTLNLGSCYFIVDEGMTLTIEGGGKEAQDGSYFYYDKDGNYLSVPGYGKIINANITAFEMTAPNSRLVLNHVVFASNAKSNPDYGAVVTGGGYTTDKTYNNTSGTLYLDIDNCYFVNGGPAIRFFNLHHSSGSAYDPSYYYSGSITVKNSVFSGNSTGSIGLGGAIRLEQYTTATFDDCEFINNTANNGGAIHVEQYSTVTLNRVTVRNNKAGGNGGGIYACNYGFLVINDSVIDHNTASSMGGGIWMHNPDISYFASVTLNNTEVYANSASYGGGIAVQYNALVTVEGGSLIYENIARSHGGGIFATYSGIVTINDAEIYQNEANGIGGGIFASNNSSVTAEDANIHDNEAGDHGGGIFAASTVTLSLTASHVDDNTSGGMGGGLFVSSNSTLNISGTSTISGNASGGMGGGFYLGDGSLSTVMYISDTTISGNTAAMNSSNNSFPGNGGGAYVANSVALQMSNVTVSDNTALGGWGGGLFVGNSAALTVYTSKITGNKALITEDGNQDAGSGGGILATSSATLTLVNTTVSENEASSSGGGLLMGEGAKLYLDGESSVCDNTAGGNGGGLFVTNGAALEMSQAASVSNNKAGKNGGGIYGRYSTFTLDSGSEIAGNEATYNGGGLYLEDFSKLSLSNHSAIKDNVALNGAGGGIYSVGSSEEDSDPNTVIIRNSMISNNGAETVYSGDGGGIYVMYTDLTVDQGSEITDNDADNNGGGILLGEHTALTMDKVTLQGNTAGYTGGGIAAINRKAPIIPGLGEDFEEVDENAVKITLEITDSKIVSNHALGTTDPTPESPAEGGNGGGLYLSENTVLNLSGSTVSDNTARRNGGGICSVNPSRIAANELIITDTDILSNTAGTAETDKIKDNVPEVQKEYGNGGGLYLVGSVLNIENGLNIANNIARAEGGGIYVTRYFVENEHEDTGESGWYSASQDSDFVESVVTMNGGKISGNMAEGLGVKVLEDADNDWGYGGGGVCVRSSTFILNDGGISGNKSKTSGGGILVSSRNGWAKTDDPTPSGVFKMYGGTIDGNIAQKREGGGIALINSSALITDGNILNNKTGYMVDDPDTPYTEYGDWGGGGIFVSERTVLQMPTTVLVKENEAGGFGGGVADCATGNVFIYNDDEAGMTIYDNKASNGDPHLTTEISTKPEDHNAAKDPVFMANGYQDYYGENFTYMRNKLVGGAYANWQGSADRMPVQLENDDELIAFERTGLTAYPENAPTTARVVIAGNVSYTHGGGIMCNGYAVIGTPEEVEIDYAAKLELAALKQLLHFEELVEDLTGYVFHFEVRDENTGEVVLTGTNDGQGNITFDKVLSFDAKNCPDDETTFTYVVSEVDTTLADVQNDTSKYRFTVTVKNETFNLLDTLPDDMEDLAVLENMFVQKFLIQEDIKVEKWDEDNGIWAETECTVEPYTDKSNTTKLILTKTDATFTNHLFRETIAPTGDDITMLLYMMISATAVGAIILLWMWTRKRKMQAK